MCLPETRVYGQLPPPMVPLMMGLAMQPFAKAERAIGVITGADHILVDDSTDTQNQNYQKLEDKIVAMGN